MSEVVGSTAFRYGATRAMPNETLSEAASATGELRATVGVGVGAAGKAAIAGWGGVWAGVPDGCGWVSSVKPALPGRRGPTSTATPIRGARSETRPDTRASIAQN